MERPVGGDKEGGEDEKKEDERAISGASLRRHRGTHAGPESDPDAGNTLQGTELGLIVQGFDHTHASLHFS